MPSSVVRGARRADPVGSWVPGVQAVGWWLVARGDEVFAGEGPVVEAAARVAGRDDDRDGGDYRDLEAPAGQAEVLGGQESGDDPPDDGQRDGVQDDQGVVGESNSFDRMLLRSGEPVEEQQDGRGQQRQYP